MQQNETHRKRRWLGRMVIAAGLLLGLSAGAVFAYTTLTAGEAKCSVTPIVLAPAAVPDSPVLRVMSLNLAHGRSDGRNQLLQSTRTICANLDSVASLLRRESPHVVALQEADGPCFWSGRFDHVARLARDADFHSCARGANVDGLGLSYGAGLLSQLPLQDATAYAFSPTPPTFTKGYMLATVQWQGHDIDIVSLHLDFARLSARSKQVDAIIRELRNRSNLRIIMGDFNCEWTGAEDSLRRFAEALQLEAHEPDSTAHISFPFTGHRLDWILASPALEFRRHAVLEDVVSDHLPVLAEFAIRAEHE
jgi:endonuclease/exonuclease/phosphatase family metal-dependent hydrolase